jgi:hypothetical protein
MPNADNTGHAVTFLFETYRRIAMVSSQSPWAAALLVAVSWLCPTTLAAEDAIDPVGRPEQFKQGAQTGYALYYENGTWHLRTTSKDKAGKKVKKAVFTGTISVTRGRITGGTFQGLEVARKVKELPTSDWVRMRSDKTGFEFRLKALGKTDGLSFQVSPGSESVTFNLLNSGDEDRQAIMIGKHGQHPEKVPFSLPAHPGRLQDEKRAQEEPDPRGK